MNLTHKHATRPGALWALALTSVAVLIAGCGGGSSSSPGVAHLGTNAGSSTTTGGSAASQGSGSPEAEAVAFAKCMRSNGLPNFPEPKPGGGFQFRRGAGVDPSSPAFKAAQAKCKRFQPEGGPGSGLPPSAQTLAHYLKVAQCMRAHGVPEFPDPRTSVPSNLHPPAGASRFVVSDIEGVILVMGSIDEQSPLFTRAAAACAFPLHNH
ncbi:MAG: hypothetical protein WBQ21_13190 [Solirubrobacteraceae bacterium]